MTRTLIGLDSQGVASVKISTDAYDPVTTPDTTYGAWLYNSKFSPVRFVGSLLASGNWDYPTTRYIPEGSGLADYDIEISNGVSWRIRNKYFQGLHYDIPVFSARTKQFNGRYSAKVRQQSYGWQDHSGYYTSSWGYSWFQNFYALSQGYDVGNCITIDVERNNSGYTIANTELFVWDLPGDETALLDPPRAPVSGQTSVIIDNSTCRVAKPGYDANTASETQLAFDSAVLPIKVVASGDVFVPSGESSVSVGAIPDDCLADVHFYTGDDIYYPSSPLVLQDPSLGAEYWISGGQLRFSNSFGGCRARYMVYANNSAGPTYGNNDVLRQFSDGGQDVVQFLRPGCGPNPTFADIILDSRWPAAKIISEGYFGVGEGMQEHVVNFDAGGAFPFVKYMTVHDGGSSNTASWAKAVREPFYKMLYARYQYTPRMSGDASYCRLRSNEARFWTNRGAPIRIFYADSEDYERGKTSTTYDNSPIHGIRYFIFGIPPS